MMQLVQHALPLRSAYLAHAMMPIAPVAHAAQRKSVFPNHALTPTTHAPNVLQHKSVFLDHVMTPVTRVPHVLKHRSVSPVHVMMPTTRVPYVPKTKSVSPVHAMMQTAPVVHACPISSVSTTHVRIFQKDTMPTRVFLHVHPVLDASKANVNLVRRSAVAHAATTTRSATKSQEHVPIFVQMATHHVMGNVAVMTSSVNLSWDVCCLALTPKSAVQTMI